MSEYILSPEVKKSLDFDSSVLNRAERTPGAVAVSEYTAGDWQGQEKPLPVFPVQTHSPDTDDSTSKHNKTCDGNGWTVVGQCQKEKDKFFAKRIYCGKEWCPVCGEKLSRTHRRRIARALKKALQIENMGYFVIEFPDAYRKVIELAYSKNGLQETTNKIMAVMGGRWQGRKGKTDGYFNRGLGRWHYFGDKSQGKWNPHFNLLVDSEFIEPERLEQIKADIREVLGIPDMIINYSYAGKDNPARKYHFVEYIFRSTFRQYGWNPYMAEQLYGFRNSRWFGKWNGEAVWHVEPEMEKDLLTADALDSCKCPDCGGDLKWSKPIHPAYLNIWQAVEIGQTGFYRIPVRDFTGDHMTPRQLMILDSMEWTVTANAIMRVRDKNTVWNETLAYIDDNDFIEYEIPGECMREVQGVLN